MSGHEINVECHRTSTMYPVSDARTILLIHKTTPSVIPIPVAIIVPFVLLSPIKPTIIAFICIPSSMVVEKLKNFVSHFCLAVILWFRHSITQSQGFRVTRVWCTSHFFGNLFRSQWWINATQILEFRLVFITPSRTMPWWISMNKLLISIDTTTTTFTGNVLII